MRIAAVEPFIVHLPVTGNAIADSTHQVTPWASMEAFGKSSW